MKFYLNEKKISKKSLKEMVGERRLNTIVEESKETFREDPCICIQYMVSGGILTVEVL